MIDYSVLFLGTGTFLLSFFIHIFVWRIIRPHAEIIWLGIIFIILPIALYLGYSFCHSDPDVFYQGKNLKSDFFLVFLWHCLLSFAYIMSYPAVQAESPSLKIILSVADSMPKGMTDKEINAIFSEDVLLNERVEDLVRDGLIFLKDGNKCVLSGKGRLLAMFFSGYRGLLGLPEGEG